MDASQATARFDLARNQAVENAAPRIPTGPNQTKVREAAVEFEAVFLTQMLQHMFEGIEVDGVFGGGHGEEMFRSLQLNEYGRVMARGGGIGLSQQLEREMLRLQEVKS
ncbi:MAG TPA: rod-binding protein [Azospirillaceae bacterium]|nr:rod-binding protein [Azospirillaceae bacterium]